MIHTSIFNPTVIIHNTHTTLLTASQPRHPTTAARYFPQPRPHAHAHPQPAVHPGRLRRQSPPTAAMTQPVSSRGHSSTLLTYRPHPAASPACPRPASGRPAKKGTKDPVGVACPHLQAAAHHINQDSNPPKRAQPPGKALELEAHSSTRAPIHAGPLRAPILTPSAA